MPQKYLEKLGQERYGDPESISNAWKVSPLKAKFVYDYENLMAICDSTGVCKFMSEYALFAQGIHLDDFASLLSAVTGENFTSEDLVAVAERQLLIERAYNYRAGFSRDDDYPTAFNWERKRQEPHPLYKGKLPITLEEYDSVLEAYYGFRGCDRKLGIPTEKKLKDLGLEDIAEDLKRRKSIGEEEQ
jgi:aldehyde:ferredoxin oxidoreductase